MRKADLYGMAHDEAVAFLSAAPSLMLATTSPEGAPIFRVLNAACLDGYVYFHGAPVGEKTLALGRECVVSASEIVAEIPSHWVDPERACPATTLFRSVQVHGTLEEVTDRPEKAAALEALMRKHQPEGGYVPLDDPMYHRELDSLLVMRVSLERLDGKAKLAQNRKPEQRARVLEKLWERGRPGDPRAIDLITRANGDTPAFLRAPEGARFVLAPDAAQAHAVAELLVGTYWNDEFSVEDLAEAHLQSTAWLVLTNATGLVASARACSDGRKRAWIYDVIVREDQRGRGLGEAVMRLLLDHPAVRRARHVHLGTRDAEGFYARLGFRELTSLPARPYRTTPLVLSRGSIPPD